MSNSSAVVDHRPDERPRRTPPQQARGEAAPIVAAMPAPVALLDARHQVVAVNRRLLDLLGVEGDAAGRPARFLSRSPAWQRVWQLIEGGPGGPHPVTLDDGRDRPHSFDLTIAPVSDEGSVLVCLTETTAVRSLRQQLAAGASLLSAAQASVTAARDELRRAGAQISDLVGELETVSSSVETAG